jgi:PAS domain S-box-containing protein
MRGIGLDITDRKQMEEELKLREALLADAQRIANFGSFEWQPDTNAVRWTEELFRIFGLRPGEFQPTLERYIERVHPDERQDTRNRIEQSLQDGTAFEAEERIVRPDGSIRLLLSQGKWLLDEARHAKKLVGTCHDITERRATERSKTRLEAEVQQFQKMESVGRLAGGLAHDFNNLLTVILGHASLCEQGLPPDSPARVSLAKIQHAAEDAATLTRHLLTFSRRQVVHPIGLDLNAAIEKISAMLTRVIGEHISLHIIRAESLNRIRADAGQIDQILMNLVLNAVEAMPKGGEIFIETANVELDENYAKFRPPVGPGSYVMLSVADTGSGMDSQTLSRIFDPFFITKQAGAATGLGLSIVQRAVEQNNGQITVSSQPGKGTTFKIYFPRVSGPSDVVSSSAEESLPKGSGTILLVEDDEAVRELTTDLLTSHGYKVLAARNGADALDVSHRHRHKIDLLLTDVVMPEISGPDLADKLKVHHPDLNVLYMSGYAGRLLAHHGILKMDSAFLSKPFTKHDLLV